MNGREIIKKIEADGWLLVQIKGSHHPYPHPLKDGIVTAPHPRKDLPKDTVKPILKQAGLA